MVGHGRNHSWMMMALVMLAAGCGPLEDWIKHHPGHGGGGSGSSSGGHPGSSSSSSGGYTGSSSSSSGGYTGSSSSSSGGYTGSSSSSSGGYTGSSSSGGPGRDYWAPTTSASPGSGVYAGSVDVTLACSDDWSGCAGTSYVLTTASAVGAPTQYVGPIHLTETAILNFSSVDAAGNAEAMQELLIEVLPVGAAPHLRIVDGWFWIATPRTGLPRPGQITLTERWYPNTGFYIGDAVRQSIAGSIAGDGEYRDQEYVVTSAGQPLYLYQDEESFQASGLALAVRPDSTSQRTVEFLAGPGVTGMFPLRFDIDPTAVAMTAGDAGPLPGSLDIPDVPLLLDYSHEGGGAPIRFTGSLLRGSLGAFGSIKLAAWNPETGGGCEEIIPRDSPMLRTAEGADIWSDVVDLTPAGSVAACLAPPYVSPSFDLLWEGVAASWVEAIPLPLGSGVVTWTLRVGEEDTYDP